MSDFRLKVSEIKPPLTGFLDGHWIDSMQMSISVSDPGFRQAVTAVERLRTYNGLLFQLDAHLRRWHQTINHLGIEGLPADEQIHELIEELFRRNDRILSVWRETGVTMFATPGSAELFATPSSEKRINPTLGLHLNRLDLPSIESKRISGQRLIVTDIRQPSAESWPRQIKVRCRLHYYLADQAARAVDPNAVGVLIDDDNSITETSIGNIAIVESGEIYSPPSDRILHGITQGVVEGIAESCGLQWHKQAISIDRLQNAGEVLLMGTDTGIWFANQVNANVIRDGNAGDVCQMLLKAFDELTDRNQLKE